MNASDKRDLSYGEKHPEVLAYFRHALFVQAIFIFVLNTFCLWIIFRRASVYKKLQNIDLSGVLISHAANGLCFMLHYILMSASAPKVLWYYILMVRDTFYISSALYTIMVTLDRYLAIKRPFYYATLDRKFAIISNFIIIVFVIALKITSVVLQSALIMIVIMLLFVIFTAAVVVFNSVLYREVRKQYISITSMAVHSSIEEQKKHTKYINKRQLRALKICLLLTTSFVLFWTPYIVAVCLFHNGFHTFTVWKIRRSLELFNLLNPILDVAVYASLNRDMKEEIRKCIKHRVSQ